MQGYPGIVAAEGDISYINTEQMNVGVSDLLDDTNLDDIDLHNEENEEDEDYATIEKMKKIMVKKPISK